MSSLRERGSEKDDPIIIRHEHDLAALENIVAADETFGSLLVETLYADSIRGNGAVSHLPPLERLAAMLEKLSSDPLYRDDYDIFVRGLTFAGVEEVPDFAAATEALRRLTTMVAT